MKKAIAIGTETFDEMRLNNSYYVDKTAFIRPIMESGSYVHLITRPRRFGKSLFMDMLRSFLDVDAVNPGDTARQKTLFVGLQVLEATDFCERFMGQHPVLYVSFQDVAGANFNEARCALADTLWEIADTHAYLLESPQLSEEDRIFLRNCCSWDYLQDPSHLEAIKTFLRRMAVILAKHFGRQVVLLVDEYDVPLKKATAGGYYEDMVGVIKALLAFLKPRGGARAHGRLAVKKAVLTGCLRVSKESIFTGLNNPDVNTVCSDDEMLAEAMGFTQKEVDELLCYCGLEARRDIVKAWYDGYRFAQSEIYCPWDVVNFCAKAMRKLSNPLAYQPQNFWSGTSDNAVIDEFLGFLAGEETDRMQTLLDGGEIEIDPNEELTYEDFPEHKPRDFWTLLLFSGYLTVVSRAEDGRICRVRIPNEEIRQTFDERVRLRFSKKNPRFERHGVAFAQALLKGDAEEARSVLLNVLRKYVSVRDAATRARAENFYHAFVLALLAGAEDVVSNVVSNGEAGDGYADILFTSLEEDIGIVIEIKHCGPQEKLLSAEAALHQIREKHYVHKLADFGCRKYLGFGLAFSGKSCVVAMESLDPAED